LDWFLKVYSILRHGGDVPAIDRFTDELGHDRQRAVILRNPIVDGDESLANEILDAGEVVRFKKGEDIVTEGDVEDDSIFFILAGAADVFVNGKRRDDIQRVAPVSIGEMAALDPTKARNATVRAASKELVALKVAGKWLRKLAEDDEEFRKRVNADIAGRGRQAIVATGLSQSVSGWRWTVVALIAAILAAFAVRYAMGDGEGSAVINFAVPFIVGLVIFVTVLLNDPAYRFFRLGALCVGALLVNEALQWQVRGSFIGIEFEYGLSSTGAAQSETTWLAPVVLGSLAAFLFWIDANKRK
jgi:CRP-like cAMP-binding protein